MSLDGRYLEAQQSFDGTWTTGVPVRTLHSQGQILHLCCAGWLRGLRCVPAAVGKQEGAELLIAIRQ
jgi:hypothetical protein